MSIEEIKARLEGEVVFVKLKRRWKHFHVIAFDGWNVGLAECFADSFLEFDTGEEARSIASHWDRWVSEGK